MEKKKPLRDVIAMNIRFKRETWEFLKMVAMEQDRSMVEIIRWLIENYRKELKMKLTDTGTKV